MPHAGPFGVPPQLPGCCTVAARCGEWTAPPPPRRLLVKPWHQRLPLGSCAVRINESVGCSLWSKRTCKPHIHDGPRAIYAGHGGRGLVWPPVQAPRPPRAPLAPPSPSWGPSARGGPRLLHVRAPRRSGRRLRGHGCGLGTSGGRQSAAGRAAAPAAAPEPAPAVAHASVPAVARHAAGSAATSPGSCTDQLAAVHTGSSAYSTALPARGGCLPVCAAHPSDDLVQHRVQRAAAAGAPAPGAHLCRLQLQLLDSAACTLHPVPLLAAPQVGRRGASVWPCQISVPLRLMRTSMPLCHQLCHEYPAVVSTPLWPACLAPCLAACSS